MFAIYKKNFLHTFQQQDEVLMTLVRYELKEGNIGRDLKCVKSDQYLPPAKLYFFYIHPEGNMEEKVWPVAFFPS